MKNEIVITSIIVGVVLFITASIVSIVSVTEYVKREKTTYDSTTIRHTQTTSTTRNSTALDYLPKSKQAMDELKEYFGEQGYSFDDWYVAQDDGNVYAELKNGTGGVVINYSTNNYMLNLGNTSSGANSVMWETGSNAKLDVFVTTECGDAFEVLELMLSSCPEELKPSMSELKKVKELTPNNVGATEYLDIEEKGTYYRLNYVTKGNGKYLYMIAAYKNKPNGWNG